MYFVGASVGFYSGDIRRLSDDMKALRPTVTPAVPRLLNRIYDKVQAEVGRGCIKKMLFNMAMSAKENEIKRQVVMIRFQFFRYIKWNLNILYFMINNYK